MLYFEELKNVLIVSIACSIVVSSLVQKIKENLKSSKYVIIINFFVSLIVGPFFALSFSSVTFIDSLWAGLFSFIGADMLYQMFEDKIFKPFSKMNNKVCIDKENNIRGNNNE